MPPGRVLKPCTSHGILLSGAARSTNGLCSEEARFGVPGTRGFRVLAWSAGRLATFATCSLYWKRIGRKVRIDGQFLAVFARRSCSATLSSEKRVMKDHSVLRVATYNTHKGRGLDGRIRPSRVAEVLREFDADVIALQEVVSLTGGRRDQNQAQYLADTVGFEFRIGETRKLRGAAYGNVVLSRLPVKQVEIYDLTASRREPRGCIRCDVEVAHGKIVHVFNIHLGTGYLERRKQAHMLMSRDVLLAPSLRHPRLLLGDFNEWTRGLVSRMMQAEFESVDIQLHLNRRRTYPGVLPFMHLDHMYFDRQLVLEEFSLHRSRKALVASDHLPLLAAFRLSGK